MTHTDDIVERLTGYENNARHLASQQPVGAMRDQLLRDGDLFGSAAAEITRLLSELASKAARVEKLEERLEITSCGVLENGEIVTRAIPPDARDSFPDGISARDATIELLDEEIKKLSAARDLTIEECARVAKEAAVNEELILKNFAGRPDLAGVWQDACNYIFAGIRSLKSSPADNGGGE